MKRFLHLLILAAMPAATGCGSLNTPKPLSDLALRYYNAQYDFTFFLPASWQGFSVLPGEWSGQKYIEATDKMVIAERGPEISLRHPRWQAGEHWQDIPIRIFTRAQWEEYHHGGGFSVDVGGFEEEIAHNRKWVFAISSRFNADDSVPGCSEAGKFVEQNQTANGPSLYPM